MADKEPIASVTYDKQNAEVYLNAALLALRGALTLAVDRLAQIEGREDLSWLDDIRSEAVLIAKGTVANQTPVEVDAGAVRFGFQLLEAEFDSIRRGLVKPE